MAIPLILGEMSYIDTLLSGRLTEHMMDETQGIRTKKTDPITTGKYSSNPFSHAEPPSGQRSHYSGRKSYRPRSAYTEPILTRQKASFRPTTGPQPKRKDQRVSKEKEHSASTGQHGSVGPLQAHGHTVGISSNITPSKSHQDIQTVNPEATGIEKKIQAIKKTPLSGLPETTSNMQTMVALARLNYMKTLK